MPTKDDKLNLNTILLAVLMALSGWTLNRVSDLSERMSAVAVMNTNYTRELLELRARITSVEAQVQEIKLLNAKAAASNDIKH